MWLSTGYRYTVCFVIVVTEYLLLLHGHGSGFLITINTCNITTRTQRQSVHRQVNKQREYGWLSLGCLCLIVHACLLQCLPPCLPRWPVAAWLGTAAWWSGCGRRHSAGCCQQRTRGEPDVRLGRRLSARQPAKRHIVSQTTRATPTRTHPHPCPWGLGRNHMSSTGSLISAGVRINRSLACEPAKPTDAPSTPVTQLEHLDRALRRR